MRLFVDVDDTLVQYDSEGEIHPYGFVRNEPYRVNQQLVTYIRQFRVKRPEALIVIWSGGGTQYAAQVAAEMLPGVDVVPMLKDKTTFKLVRPEDIVFDDEPIHVLGQVFRPDDVGP